MEAHGGTVTVASEGPGLGTEVTILLPLAAVTAEEISAPVSAVRSGAQRLDGLCVLVIEDLDDTLEATRVMLKWLGADVLTATDGVEALQTARGKRVDLVLCDLLLPRLDGFQFLEALRHQDGDTHRPVIAISTLVSSADHLRIEAAGFDGYVDKPFDAVRLLAAIDDVLARRFS